DDLHAGLRIARRREDLRFRRGDRAVAFDKLGGDATERLDAERERRDVEEQNVLDLTLEDAGLDGRADGDDLIRVHALVRLLAEQLLDRLHDLRHARHAADQDDLVDLVRGDVRVLEAAVHRVDRLLPQGDDELLELAARERDDEVLRTGLIRRDERQVDLGLHGARELDLGLLGGFLQTLKRVAIAAQVDALVLLELVDEPIHDPGVEVVTTEVRVTVGG